MRRSNPAERAQKALAQLELVTDNGKLLTAIRYYTAVLTPGVWTPLKPPRRAGSRDLNPSWKAHLWAVRRILNIPYRKKNDGCCYRLRANYARLLLSATGLDLDNVLVRQKFEKIPYDFRLNDPKTNAFSLQHPHVLERAKDALFRFYSSFLVPGELAPLTRFPKYQPVQDLGPAPLTSQPPWLPKAKRPNPVRPPTVERVLGDRVHDFLSRIVSGD